MSELENRNRLYHLLEADITDAQELHQRTGIPLSTVYSIRSRFFLASLVNDVMEVDVCLCLTPMIADVSLNLHDGIQNGLPLESVLLLKRKERPMYPLGLFSVPFMI